ncbi:MAG: response regulator GlrR [Pseudomonadota bacterium]|jgi:two-component system response regulator GlrR
MNTAYHILLVDDDTDLLQLLSMRLKAAGYLVRTAQNGKEALALIPVIRPHLVITDLRMDGMDGLTLFKFLQQSNPALPVIILTAHGTIPDAVEAAHQGVFRFLTKPFDSKILLEHIAQALKLSSDTNDREEKLEKWRAAIITRSPSMEELLSQAKLVAESEANVFIHGDSGTGKELLAQAIHLASPRANRDFIPVNCSAIPETLFESELFGHAKGSFTGALKDHRGLFQTAHLGTLFLDEIGDLPLTLQTKLLRVLQERKIRPVGSTTAIDIDVRVISATHVNLEERLKKGLFREDLYYRLNVVNLEIPTLSQRREDIPLLAKYFLGILTAKNRKNISGFAPESLELLVHANFPGNVRQLFNVVEQCVALSLTPIIPATLVQKALRDKPLEILPFNEARQRFERDYLIQILQITGGNAAQAARLAQRNRTDFYKLLERHNLTPASFKTTDEEK